MTEIFDSVEPPTEMLREFDDKSRWNIIGYRVSYVRKIISLCSLS